MPSDRIELTKEEFDRGIMPFPNNHVLVKTIYSSEGAKTKGGVIVGFNTDTVYAEGDNSWAADMQEVSGIVERVPEKLYFNDDKDDINSMEWECDMELKKGDEVWYGLIEATNSYEILCEGNLYKLIPYADIYVAKRDKEVIPLNGYILMQTTHRTKISELDYLSEDKVDNTKGIVKFVGKPNKRYRDEAYADFVDLRKDDIVVVSPRTPFLFLERKSYMARFDGDNLYVVMPRRKILSVLNR